mgnify:CR=1 FL=1
MADGWPDLVRGLDRLTVTRDLRERVEALCAVMQQRRNPRFLGVLFPEHGELCRGAHGEQAPDLDLHRGLAEHVLHARVNITINSRIIRKALELSDSQLEWLIAVAILSGALLRLNFGIWADRFGGRNMMVFLLLFAAIPTYLFSLAADEAGHDELRKYCLAAGVDFQDAMREALERPGGAGRGLRSTLWLMTRR